MSLLETRKRNAIAEIAAVAHLVPSVIIILDIQKGFTVEYMSDRGLQMLKTTTAELKALGLGYYAKFFNEEDAKFYIPKVKELMQRNDPEHTVTFFQQVRPSPEHEWGWYLSAAKILLQDDDGQPLLIINMATPIDPENHVTKKVTRVMEENMYMKANFERFFLLTKREKEVLELQAQGKGNKEIAETLFISVSTAETHRKNIKRKLDAHSNEELYRFARAFDLI